MKKRSFVLVLFSLMALLVWWLWPRARLAPDLATALSEKTAPMAEIPLQPSLGTREQKLNFVREIVEKSNKPIEFYGLILDQYNNPVSDVKVTFSVRSTKEVEPGKMLDGFDYPVVESNTEGRFSITGIKGALLSVKSLEKFGYDASAKSVNRAHYWYWSDPQAVFRPDSEKPEIFRMWKKVGAERLERKGISSSLSYDGASATFDLLTGAVGDKGDLRVSLMRNPQRIKYGQRNYEWTLTVECLGGGVLESNDEQMYLAPVEGYQSRLVFHMDANAPDWTDEKSFNLYLRLRGGSMYGRAELKALVGSDRAKTPFYIMSFINPSGSRNLEYDAAQDVIKEPSRIKKEGDK